jgi:hypothetical protein
MVKPIRGRKGGINMFDLSEKVSYIRGLAEGKDGQGNNSRQKIPGI